MMKKVILIIVIVAAVLFIRSFLSRTSIKEHTSKPVDELSTGKTNEESNNRMVEISERSLFVPYWNLQNINRGGYNKLIYFGISTTEEGINREDQGFANIQEFSSRTTNTPTLLTLRMLDADTNIAILENPQLQRQLAVEVADVAKEYDFAGVVLDLELSVIPFSNIKDQISSFVTVLDSEFESRSLQFGVALYGDTYFRARPYDVKRIGESADEIFIMAYDFHKSRGEPGPNYPLSKGTVYGYDFKDMITDFSADIEPEKITVIFGMYGYKWTLGKQGMPLKAATSFSLLDAQEMFYPKCNYKSCSVNRDENSAEMKVTYTDTEGYKNEAWFEDKESMLQKSDYLKQQGIGSVSYWVNGYF